MKELFADTSRELEETAANLQQSEQYLHTTRRHLRQTRQQRDEQAHLVSARVQHEAALRDQATQVRH